MPVDASIGKHPDQSLKLTPIAEGLYESGVPAFLQTAWDNTFILYSRDMKNKMQMVGTGFPIMKRRIGDTNYVLMLTSGHVGDPISKLNLAGADRLVIAQDSKVFFTANSKAPTFDGRVDFQSVKILSNVALDASAILITLSDDQFEAMTPFHFPTEGCASAVGAKTYLIGFPAVNLRPIAKQNVKIVNPTTIQKRWSVGLSTTDTAVDGFQSGATQIPLVGSTTDSLEGDSGGPNLNAQGELIGMENAGSGTAAYSGNEKTTPMLSSSYAASCSDLQDFVFSSWVKLTH